MQKYEQLLRLYFQSIQKLNSSETVLQITNQMKHLSFEKKGNQFGFEDFLKLIKTIDDKDNNSISDEEREKLRSQIHEILRCILKRKHEYSDNEEEHSVVQQRR